MVYTRAGSKVVSITKFDLKTGDLIVLLAPDAKPREKHILDLIADNGYEEILDMYHKSINII